MTIVSLLTHPHVTPHQNSNQSIEQIKIYWTKYLSNQKKLQHRNINVAEEMKKTLTELQNPVIKMEFTVQHGMSWNLSNFG